MNKKSILILIVFIVISASSIYIIVNNKNGKNYTEDKTVESETATDQLNQNIDKVINEIKSAEDSKKESEIILFFGDGCPHCAQVEKFVTDNNIESKISFTKKEVYYNQNNAKELESKAKACGMPTDSIGVPFLWDGSGCLVGDQDIIDFFKLKAN